MCAIAGLSHDREPPNVPTTPTQAALGGYAIDYIRSPDNAADLRFDFFVPFNWLDANNYAYGPTNRNEGGSFFPWSSGGSYACNKSFSEDYWIQNLGAVNDDGLATPEPKLWGRTYRRKWNSYGAGNP